MEIQPGKSIVVTFLLLPTADLSELKFVATFDNDKTLSSMIQYEDGSAITFQAHKKSYVKGLATPYQIIWTVSSSEYGRSTFEDVEQ